MPKSAKKRKEKAADFSRAKLKLGKGKQLASNAIDTSFKARSIALPTQSIATEKDESAPTTKRKLTFDDLVIHLKHYNAGTRKDAILGFKELFEAHPELVIPSLTTLLNASVRVISDEDASVRKTLLSFFAWFLPQIPTDILTPHSSSLLLFTTSAQTHIFPEIRIDAIRLLDIFIEVIPETVIAGWNTSGHGNRVLEGYLGILNAGTKFGDSEGPVRATSTASVVLSPGSKLVVIRSLSHFLQKALSPHATSGDDSPTIPTWYLASSFTEARPYEAFDRIFQPRYHSADPSYACHQWKPEVDPDTHDEDFIHRYSLGDSTFQSHWSLDDLSELAAGPNVDDSAFVAHLAHTLHSTLVSMFLDCAPQVFSPSSAPPGVEVQLVLATVRIVRCLYASILQGPSLAHETAVQELKIILDYMTTYFPFACHVGSRDMKLEQTFQDLNILFCELTSLLVLASPRSTSSREKKSRFAAALALQTEQVSEYVTQLLRGEAMSPSQLSRPLSQAAYVALLPTLWSLLNNPCPISAGVLQAVLEHSLKASSHSAVKKSTIEFVARLALLETEVQYKGRFVIVNNSEEERFEEWIKHLPKVLWEVGSNSLGTTETILRTLLRLFQRKSRLLNYETMTAVCSRLAPYFSIDHPTRGRLAGPFVKLPAPIRRLTLDVVATSRLLRSGSDLWETVAVVVAGTGDSLISRV